MPKLLETLKKLFGTSKKGLLVLGFSSLTLVLLIVLGAFNYFTPSIQEEDTNKPLVSVITTVITIEPDYSYLATTSVIKITVEVLQP